MAGTLSRLTKKGLRKGVVDGSRAWLVLGMTAAFLQVARRLWAREPISHSVRLEPGETIEVRHLRSS